MAVLVGVAVIGRREVQNWLADWLSRRQQPWLSVFLRVGAAKDAVTTWSEIGGFAKTVLCIVTAIVIISVVCGSDLAALVRTVLRPGARDHAVADSNSEHRLPVGDADARLQLSLVHCACRRNRGSRRCSAAIPCALPTTTLRKTTPTLKALAEQFAKLPGDAPKPAILVATAGGGSRAAYWTATVLGKLNTIRCYDKYPCFNDHLLLISGVSGGSLGALLYRAATLAAPNDPDKALDIAQEAAAGDFLSPLLSAMFTRDLVSDLIPGSTRSGRGHRAGLVRLIR